MKNTGNQYLESGTQESLGYPYMKQSGKYCSVAFISLSIRPSYGLHLSPFFASIFPLFPRTPDTQAKLSFERPPLRISFTNSNVHSHLAAYRPVLQENFNECHVNNLNLVFCPQFLELNDTTFNVPSKKRFRTTTNKRSY